METDATYDVVLLPTFIQVEAWRKARAREGGLFGTRATTFNAWVADLWELHGDGRRLVDSVCRETAMRVAFAQVAAKGRCEGAVPPDAAGADARHGGPGGREGSLTLSPGIAPLAARCESQAAGVAEFDAAVQVAGAGGVPGGLSAREGLFLSGIARYRQLIGGLGMVEPGEACAWLARRSGNVFPRPLRVLLEDAAPLDWRMRRFFDACPQLQADVHPAAGADGVRRLPAGVAPRFAFPAGRYAQAALVADIVRDAVAAGGDAVVTSPDPLALYLELEPALAARGIVCALQARQRFGATDFGRAFLQVNRLMADAGWDAVALADVLHSPFSGLSGDEARAHDARLRGDRLASREACLAELRERHPAFAAFCGLASRDASAQEAALANAERIARASQGRSPAWQSCQLAAIAAARLVLAVAGPLQGDAEDALAVLERTVLSLSHAGIPQGDAAPAGPTVPQVLVTTQGAAARRAQRSCAVLVAAGLTADAYPLADKDDAATTLLAKLGLAPTDDALSRARRDFRALQQLPTQAFVCMRPLNDADGNPAYPCAMWEEFIDAYRAPGDGAAAPHGLPGMLSDDIRERGEELLYANAASAPADAVQPVSARAVPTPPGDAGAARRLVALPRRLVALPRRLVALPRRLHGGGVLEDSPSPSQMELYLECPYKWFIQRRLGVERLEEGFGALERGTFAHAVLERFYRGFGRKVAPGDLPEAKRQLRAAADAVEAEMRGWEPGSGRLVAASRLEARDLAQFKAQLADYLDFEAKLLPGFAPAYLEYAFDAGHAARYAGCSIVGTVDRIDVDGRGHAVVIDYKGSLNAEHDIAGKDAAHPGKVQTRMYAQMVQRELGLQVVGALYVSYGRRPALSGAADGRVLEAAHLPGSREMAVWCAPGAAAAPDAGGGAPVPYSGMAFAEMLDATEELVAEAHGRMKRGEIAPMPSSASACKWCPATDCPSRRA